MVQPNGFSATLHVWKETDLLGRYRDDYQVGSEQWVRWLQLPDSKSFRFEPINSAQTTFTARREERANDAYWYAYKKIEGKTHKVYLAKSSDLTLERMEEVASGFANNYINPISKQSYTKQICVTSQEKVPLVTRSELEAIAQELLANNELTRHGKDRGTVKRTIAAFTDRLMLLLEG